METTVDEIAPDIFRLSTFVPDAGMVFNQYLVRAEEPLLFHTGFRSMFPLVGDAIGRVVPLERLRWVAFGHVEGDESGAMNDLLAAAPRAEVAHTPVGCMVQLNQAAVRPPRMVGDGEVLDLGGRRVRFVATPHVPHGWDAQVVFEETTSTLLCGDLFTALGAWPATTAEDVVGPALAAEDLMHATALTPSTAPTLRALADLGSATLALMHGPAYTGDGEQALRDLADGYDERLQAALAATRV